MIRRIAIVAAFTAIALTTSVAEARTAPPLTSYEATMKALPAFKPVADRFIKQLRRSPGPGQGIWGVRCPDLTTKTYTVKCGGFVNFTRGSVQQARWTIRVRKNRGTGRVKVKIRRDRSGT